MRLRARGREWKAAAAIALLAVALIMWTAGLPGGEPGREGRRGEGPRTPAEETADWLSRLIPPGGSRGFPNWRELARLGRPDPDVSGPIGFGGQRLGFEKLDAGVRWTVMVLLDSSGDGLWPVAIEVTCKAADGRAGSSLEDPRRAWSGETSPAPGGWRARWRDPSAAADLEARARAVLGGHRPSSVPRELREAYELLLDPLRPVVYDRGQADERPRESGRVALEALLAAGRADLVRNVLRGLDPEGRVYAAAALLDRLEPEPEDEGALRALLALDVLVRTRGAARMSAREALGR